MMDFYLFTLFNFIRLPPCLCHSVIVLQQRPTFAVRAVFMCAGVVSTTTESIEKTRTGMRFVITMHR